MKGNLIDLAEQGVFNVIVHGCNCFHTMGAGVAREIKARHPTAYEADTKYTTKGDRSKLGHYSWAIVEGKIGNAFTIINAYTQYRYGRDKCHVDYDAIRNVFKTLNQQYKGQKLGYPKIGAGLAGGDWNVTQTIINEELRDVFHQLVTLT